MEASSVVMRQNPCINAHFHRNSSSSSSNKACMVMGMGGLNRRKQLNVGFCDKGHLDYYYYGGGRGGRRIRCGGGVGGGKKEKLKEEEKEEKKKKKMIKKRLKLVKDLSKDLSMFTQMMTGFELVSDNHDHDHGDALADQVRAKTISEAGELLLGELQKLRAEEMELKRKKKEEKALSRAVQMQNRECDMSSSSCSESSDSDGECGQEVVSMNRLKCGSLAQQQISAANQTVIDKETANFCDIPSQESTAMSLLQEMAATLGNDEQACGSNSLIEQEHCSETSKCCIDVGNAILDEEKRIVTALSAKKIEVCMGGKCKKSGAALLLEEFQKVTGVDVAVSACKCMGKCRDGPNVRVVNNSTNGSAADCASTTSNPLCIGVGLEDVGVIVANFFGPNQNEVGLAAAAATP